MPLSPELTANVVSFSHTHGCGCAACRDNETDPKEGSSGDASTDGSIIGTVTDLGQTLSVQGIALSQTLSETLTSDEAYDIFSLELEAGQRVQIAMNGDGLRYPMIRIEFNGTIIAVNDDGGPGFNSLLQFTATQSGFYYIQADSYSSLDSDTHEITAPEVTGTVTPHPVAAT